MNSCVSAFIISVNFTGGKLRLFYISDIEYNIFFPFISSGF